MPIDAKALRAAAVCLSALLPTGTHAQSIDTENLFGFMIGTGVGEVGEREFEIQTTGRFSRSGGHYRAINQDFELEFVPVRNVRLEVGTAFASHEISGVPGFEDRRQLAWQGTSVDLRYRLLNSDVAPVGLTFAVEGHVNRIDETKAAAVRNFGMDFKLAFDRELVPNIVLAAVNLIYQPEWTRFPGATTTEHESTIGAAFGLMAQVRPGFLIGGEARYLRKYEGIGLEAFAGQALFVGPTAYVQLSKGSRLTVSWSSQAWGRSGSTAALDLVNFYRHQARLVFGVNF
jgi:hypothetical protein